MYKHMDISFRDAKLLKFLVILENISRFFRGLTDLSSRECSSRGK